MSPATPRHRRTLRRAIPLVAVGATAALIAGITPAVADTVPVTVTVVNQLANGRTLVLQSLTGSGSPSLNGNQSGFVTGVSDTSYAIAGYTVSATMSNLYKYTGTADNPTYSCGTSIPSSKVTIKQGGLLDISGVTASLTPIVALAGTAASKPVPTSPAPTVTGLPQTLSTTSLQGAVGHITDGALSTLPIKSAQATTAGGTFDSSATSGATCDGAAATPTVIPLMTGAANATGPTGLVSAAIAGKTVPNLGSYLDTAATKSVLNGVLGAVSSLLAADTLSGVTGTLSSATNLVQSGLFQTSPSVSIDTSSVPSGNYQGVMTVTLATNP